MNIIYRCKNISVQFAIEANLYSYIGKMCTHKGKCLLVNLIEAKNVMWIPFVVEYYLFASINSQIKFGKC